MAAPRGTDDASGRPAAAEVTGEVELTTVADDEAVMHLGAQVRRYDGLTPDTVHELDGVQVRTLPRWGERLATVATVNDVHFGEEECGVIGEGHSSPTFRSAPGADPYPEVMNRGAIVEIAARRPDAVIVKGDLTSKGTEEEYASFLAAYGSAFGDRLTHVRGNHDAYEHQTFAPEGPQCVDVEGLTVALLDTTWPGHAGGHLPPEQVEWLEDLAADAGQPVLVLGHHHVWSPESTTRPDTYFGIHPDGSERLVAAVARHPNILGYAAGHTHRNRVRRIRATGERPWIEVACVKDFPGTWAEYRVFEGGVLQIHRRISTPDALAWTELTRGMFDGIYPEYAFGALDERCFAMRSPT